eukprot:639280-Prymnesium_polylepis.1
MDSGRQVVGEEEKALLKFFFGAASGDECLPLANLVYGVRAHACTQGHQITVPKESDSHKCLTLRLRHCSKADW